MRRSPNLMRREYEIPEQNPSQMSFEVQGVTARCLSGAIGWLEGAGFAATSRLPLFTARHWSPAMEWRARQRFLKGLCNTEEVAVPRWYWACLSPRLRPLFASLSLGLPGPLADSPAALLDDHGVPRWRLVRRFSRYVLASRPEVDDDSLTYFGDDTLFLIGRAREMLQGLDGPERVLDLCCGGGGVGLGLPAFEGSLVGVDINSHALDLARLAAEAQGLSHYRYLCADAVEALEGCYDLVVGNPPTLPPELGGKSTLYATGSSHRLLELIESLLGCLSARGRALLTVFSTAHGPGAGAADSLRSDLRQALEGRRGHVYTVRRQFPVGTGRWLRHVALEVLPQDEPAGQRFRHPAAGGVQLPALAWRRAPG